MAIENTYLLGKNITLGCGFDLQAKAPLDSRQTVPAFAGLQALIDGNAAYEGMIVYDEETKKTYQAQLVDDVLSFREFGINEAELKDLIASETTAAMEFKGAATALPENPAKGDMYKITAAFKIGEEDAKIGDSIVYDGEQWFIIPSGDDIEDTWRPVTGVDNDSTLTFAAGDKLEKTVAADGTITYKHVAIDAPANMNEEGDEQTRTYITQLISDNHGHIIGFKTATENVEDTNTTYEFEGLPVGEDETAPSSVYFQVKSSDAEAAEVIYLDAYNKNEADAELAKKVDKAEGYSLISDAEIERLAEVDNYDDEEVRGLIGDNADAIDELSEYVGTIPNVPDADGNNKYADLDVIGYINKKAQETLTAAQGGSSETAASVKGQLDDYIGENNTRVKAIEDDVAAIKDAETGILKQAQNYADGLAGNYDENGAAAGVQAALEVEIAKKVDKETYEADKATFAIAETVNTALNLKANATDVVANDTFESFKTTNTQAIADAKAGAISEIEAKGYAVADEVAETYATKTELGNVDKKFENYVTSASYATDKAAIDKAIEDETKARSEADAGFETRIAALESNFGDGEGTVEAQIAAAVKAEEDARKEAVKGVQDEVDAVEGRMDTAEGKISTLETESAKHAIKTEVEASLDLKADKSVVDAMYTNAQIDGFIAEAKKYADDNDADTKYGIVYDSDNKKIKLVEGGTDVEIDATAFIKDGMIDTVTIGDDNDLIITFNTDAGKENIVLPLDQLVDIYTGVEGARVKVTVASDKSISADLIAGSISKDYLDDGVKASLALADSAIQSHQDISHLATIEALNGVDAKFANYTNTTDMESALNLKADKTQVATDIAAVQADVDAAQGEVDALKAKIGNVPEGSTVMGIITNIQENAYNDTEVRGLIQDNADAIGALETEVAKKANDADLAAIAKTGSTDDLVQGDLVLIFDCGNSGVVAE